MKKLLIAALLATFSTSSMAFEILALGTSNTNCKGVERSKIFTVHLEELLRADGFDANVINAGVDGDTPARMVNRLASTKLENTRLVIFEPGANDTNKASNVEALEEILSQLQDRNIPTIYVSIGLIQTINEADETAEKYGAYYYGSWVKGIPTDKQHRQFDKNRGGHLTAKGCQLWAQNMFPLVKEILVDNNIN